jgi:tetratricopeptide (TPR) repeat protein
MPIYVKETKVLDLQSRFSLYRSKDQNWCLQKTELDSIFRNLQAQSGSLEPNALTRRFQDLEWQFAGMSDTFSAALSRYGLAKVQYYSGQEDSAICSFVRAHNLASQIGDCELAGLSLVFLGRVRSDPFGDYATAERLYDRTIWNLRKVDDRANMPYALIGRAYALLQLGQTAQAKEYFEIADTMSVALRLRTEEAFCEYYLAESYYNDGKLDSALVLARRSVSLRKELNDPSDLANSLSCEGLIQQRRGNIEDALRLYDEAQGLFCAALDTAGLSLNTLRRSSIFLQRGLVALAQASFDSVLTLHPDYELRLFATYGRALCSYKLGHLDSARSYLEECLMQIDTSRTYAPTSLMLVGFLSDKIDMYDLLTQIHIDRYSNSAAKADLDSVLLALERGKAQSLREMMWDPREEETGRPLRSLSRSASPCTLSLDTGLPASFGVNEESLNKSLSKEPRSRDSIPLASQGLGGQQVAEISVSYCQKHLLGDNETILEYCTGVFGCYVIMITKDEVSFKKLSVPSDSLDRMILDAQVHLRTRPNGESALSDFRPQSMALYDLLVPLEFRKSIAGRCLIIVPSGRLAAFPFSALIDNSGRFLCESCQVVYSPSLTVAAMIKNRQRAKPPQYRVVAVGGSAASFTSLVKPSSHDIAVNDSTGATAHPSATLPYSSREIDSVVAIFGEDYVSVLTGHLASKTTLRGIDYSGVRYLHIAAHGVADEANPLHSAIVLSSVDGKDDGRLEPIDILQLRLAADMVFLSACGTGTGQVLAGEGVVSLARPFLVFCPINNLTA